ncbi:hypothetical protein [Comamonas terrigena]|uniref:hypothetical protein n=1 Tax=Comamonas terrigena TaxID=32013 RepID=UPI0028A6F3A4|nr:hypothetical protein [Comamonas terrigena]
MLTTLRGVRSLRGWWCWVSFLLCMPAVSAAVAWGTSLILFHFKGAADDLPNFAY